MRERFHPFNTARMVHRSLRNSTLLVDHTRRLAEQLRLKSRAALLFPGPEATLIAELPVDQRPEQLVIVDGTWHQAKTLVRDLPALRDLPKYRLAPVEPSSYRLRREPNASSLSTVEATVAALRVLEPETPGFDELLQAFNGMIDRQLAHPQQGNARRKLAKPKRTLRNVPLMLSGSLENVVVAYGESTPCERGERHGSRPPLFWVAERLMSGERFACTIQSETVVDDSLLGHLELTRADFASALSLDEARAAWEAFLRPGDRLAVYSRSTVRLLENLHANRVACLVLKAIDSHAERCYSTLDELVAAERLTIEPIRHPGRAGKRLANVKALVHSLHALANR